MLIRFGITSRGRVSSFEKGRSGEHSAVVVKEDILHGEASSILELGSTVSRCGREGCDFCWKNIHRKRRNSYILPETHHSSFRIPSFSKRRAVWKF